MVRLPVVVFCPVRVSTPLPLCLSMAVPPTAPLIVVGELYWKLKVIFAPALERFACTNPLPATFSPPKVQLTAVLPGCTKEPVNALTSPIMVMCEDGLRIIVPAPLTVPAKV